MMVASFMAKSLLGKVAVVAGATRGAGRGIARMLGEAGATVYCTGRSTRDRPASSGRPETIEETADLVTAAGGLGIAVRTDHSRPEEVKALFERVGRDSRKLDILVNDIWGGDTLTEWKPFWQLDCAKGFQMLDGAVRTHVLTSRYGIPLMLKHRSGLIIEITDGDHSGYRGSLFYDLAKMGAIRLAFAMATEFTGRGITALAVTPGFLRSETVLEQFGVCEANWRDAAKKVRGFQESETPCYVGRAVAALAADPNVTAKSGRVLASWTLAHEYGFTDIDGRQPDFFAYVRQSITEILDQGGPANAEEQFWVGAWYVQLKGEPEWKSLMEKARTHVRLVPNDGEPRGGQRELNGAGRRSRRR
jgi:NAD(P)-dependent dehydrogenase (short-subunit alcohol dehydrogenase family)